MKKLYICGDSFGSADPDSHIVPWTDLLKTKLTSSWVVNNLSMVCASNLHIRMQVDRALEDCADFVIVLFTSSVRDHGLKTSQPASTSLLDDFFKIGQHNSNGRLACWSYHSLDWTCVMPPDKMKILKDYYTNIFDLDLAIYQNQCVIESTLHKLTQSQIPFLFDQGGFENPMFGGVKKYFSEFEKHKSQYNLWSLVLSRPHHRPYFHITDQNLHNEISEYYSKQIVCQPL